MEGERHDGRSGTATRCIAERAGAAQASRVMTVVQYAGAVAVVLALAAGLRPLLGGALGGSRDGGAVGALAGRGTSGR